MFRMPLSVLLIAALSICFGLPATHAATYTTNSIEPFNQTLGTLLSVTVTVDPLPITTTPDTAGPFNAPGSHNHQYPSTNVTLPFSTFTFAGGFTSTNGSNIGGSTHDHMIDRLPEVQTYTSGSAFNWFNDPNNATINLVFLPTFPVFQSGEDHSHTAPPQNVTPRTKFVYEVPEPALGIVGLAGAILIQRRRVASKRMNDR